MQEFRVHHDRLLRARVARDAPNAHQQPKSAAAKCKQQPADDGRQLLHRQDQGRAQRALVHGLLVGRRDDRLPHPHRDPVVLPLQQPGKQLRPAQLDQQLAVPPRRVRGVGQAAPRGQLPVPVHLAALAALHNAARAPRANQDPQQPPEPQRERSRGSSEKIARAGPRGDRARQRPAAADGAADVAEPRRAVQDRAPVSRDDGAVARPGLHAHAVQGLSAAPQRHHLLSVQASVLVRDVSGRSNLPSQELWKSNSRKN